MSPERIKILIFRTDRIGDLVNTSSFLYSIKNYYQKSEITLVCSSYNKIIAQNYDFIDKILIYNKSFPFFKKIEFIKKIAKNTYDILVALDGRNISYLASYFIKSKHKYAISFKKKKSFLGFKYNIFRPSLFLLKKNFQTYIICDEDYSNLEANSEFNNHYLTMYYLLFKKNNIPLKKYKHIYKLDPTYSDSYTNFFSNYIKRDFLLFHIDEKWNNLNIDLNWLKTVFNNLSSKYTIILSCGLKRSNIFEHFKKINNFFIYSDSNLVQNIEGFDNNIFLIQNLPLNFLSHFINGSKLFISSHSGAPFHISAALNVPILDFVKKEINLELDRWIPNHINYKRVFVENYTSLENDIVDQLKV